MFGTADILAAGSGGGSGFHMLWPALPDLLWGTVAFVIVATVIYKFAWPVFIEKLDERTEKIENGLKAAELARAEIAAEREDLAAQVTDAQRDAALIREKAQENAKTIVTDAQRQARENSSAIIAAAQQRIDADSVAASRVLQAELGALATDLAGKIIGEAITDPELAARVIDRFLDELAQSLPASDSAKV